MVCTIMNHEELLESLKWARGLPGVDTQLLLQARQAFEADSPLALKRYARAMQGLLDFGQTPEDSARIKNLLETIPRQVIGRGPLPALGDGKLTNIQFRLEASRKLAYQAEASRQSLSLSQWLVSLADAASGFKPEDYSEPGD